MKTTNETVALNRIRTRWEVVHLAHDGTLAERNVAQEQLLTTYGPAMHRYLLALVHRADVADDLLQQFALRLVRGDFRHAAPEHGRFRDLVKTALRRLAITYHRQRARRPSSWQDSPIEPVVESDGETAANEEFVTMWRAHLLNRAWKALQQYEQQIGRPVYRVLRWHVEHPLLSSTQQAQAFSAGRDEAVTPEWVRKWLAVARQRFADFVLAEVVRSLARPTPESLIEELRELQLLPYCREALARQAMGT